MIHFVVFDMLSGAILQFGSCEGIDFPAQQARPEENRGVLILDELPTDVSEHHVVDGEYVRRPQTFDMTRIQAEAIDIIRSEAERQRLRFITPGYGKAMAYQQKASEAQDYLRRVEADLPIDESKFPHLVEEAAALGLTIPAMAALVEALRLKWQKASSLIEGIERQAIVKVEQAKVENEVRSIQIDWSQVDDLATN